MHAHYHALAYSLFFFLIPFSFLSILFSLLSFPPFLTSFSPLFLPCSVTPLRVQLRLLLYCLPWQVFTILPLNSFCPGMGVLPRPSTDLSAAQLTTYLCWSCCIAFPNKRVLFCFLAHCGIPIQIRVDILSHYPPWHAPSDSNSSFPLLGGMSFQQDISLERAWAGTLE